MERNKYIHPHIVICESCQGRGIVKKYNSRTLIPETAVCGSCEGSGRLEVSSTIRTTMKPFIPR